MSGPIKFNVATGERPVTLNRERNRSHFARAATSKAWKAATAEALLEHRLTRHRFERVGEDEARARYGDRAGTEAIKITIAQAAALQSFPHDYPFQGTKTSQARQIGNAVPPLMAQRIIEAVAA